MKSLISVIVIVAALLLPVTTHSQPNKIPQPLVQEETTPSAQEFSIFVSDALLSSYVFGDGFVADEDPVNQFNATFDLAHYHLRFSVFNSVSLVGNDGYANETDLTPALYWRALGIDMELGSAYDFLAHGYGIWQPYFNVSKNLTYGKWTITPTARLEMPLTTPKTPFEGGWNAHAIVDFTRVVTDKFSITARTKVTYDDGIGGFPSGGLIGSIELNGKYQVNKTMSIFAGAKKYFILTEKAGRPDSLVGQIGVGFQW